MLYAVGSVRAAVVGNFAARSGVFTCQPRSFVSCRSTFKLISEAIRGGEDKDLTGMGLRRAIVLLSIPMVLEMGMESVFALVDAFYVSRLGVDAIATVGLTESVMMIIYSLAWGLGMGVTAVVSRRSGEKDDRGASRSAMQGILLATVLGLLIAVPGYFNAERVLHLMGAEAGVLAVGTGYAQIMIASNVVILLLFVNNAIYRGAGDAAMAMRVLAVANGINLVLDPLLIFGIGPFPELGVMGAAVATTIGRGTAVLYQLWALSRPKGRIVLLRSEVRLDPTVLWTIVRVSAGGVAQFIIPSLSWVFLVRIVAIFGSAAVAGYTIAVRVIMFSIMPAWGMANAASTLVGQNLGAKQPDRAERSAWLIGHYNMFFMVGVAIFFWITAPWIMHFFTTDPVVTRYGTEALRIITLGYFFYAYGMVLAQAFNGAGDTLTPTWMNIVCFWLIEIPLAWFLARTLGWGANGVFASIAISESLLALLSAAMFRRGRWKSVQV
ncbi:MAG: MATE family efflux transporter [Flavobacteriales bacterium]|nr:MATE family efflux transporter [Flavobacteriales bacterium]